MRKESKYPDLSESEVANLCAQPLKKTIWYLGQELEFRIEVETIDEAQALIDYERSQGRTGCCTHYNDKHQFYSSSHEERQ